MPPITPLTTPIAIGGGARFHHDGLSYAANGQCGAEQRAVALLQREAAREVEESRG